MSDRWRLIGRELHVHGPVTERQVELCVMVLCAVTARNSLEWVVMRLSLSNSFVTWKVQLSCTWHSLSNRTSNLDESLSHISRFVPSLPYHCSSSRIHMDALGHMLMPFCSVCLQFFGFIPGCAHILQISSDSVRPVFFVGRPSFLLYPLSSCISRRGILVSSILIAVSSCILLICNNNNNMCWWKPLLLLDIICIWWPEKFLYRCEVDSTWYWWAAVLMVCYCCAMLNLACVVCSVSCNSCWTLYAGIIVCALMFYTVLHSYQMGFLLLIGF